ncbi:MAG TPA: hypothetical protein VH084_02095, partial [Mycobacterium sp.]|nr:hypothetical protein [Mycobacterium sp.]
MPPCIGWCNRDHATDQTDDWAAGRCAHLRSPPGSTNADGVDMAAPSHLAARRHDGTTGRRHDGTTARR